MQIFLALVGRDLRLALREGWQVASALLFFLLILVLLAFGVGPDPVLLRLIAPGAIWVAALLSCLLSLDRLFSDDADQGALDQLLAAPVPTELLVLAKMTAHWLTTGLPLTILSPVAAMLLHVPAFAWPVLIAALALGTPVLSLTGGAIAALMVGARRAGMLTALLILPLYVPALIFGAGALSKAIAGGSAAGTLIFLAAQLAVALPLAPIAAAAALED